MDSKVYDEFYVAYFDSSGNVVFPTDIKEIDTIKQLLKNITKGHLIYVNNRDICYKVRIKRTVFNGQKIQMVELSNVSEYIDQISKASIDEVTSLINRKTAKKEFLEYIDYAHQYGDDLAFLLLDLDGFKAINDTYGHNNGDVVLSEVSRIIYHSTRQCHCRDIDIVTRIGGDEFAVVFKNISKQVAITRAEQIRSNIEKRRIPLLGETNSTDYINIGTASIGLYHMSNTELTNYFKLGYTIEQIHALIYERTDNALYRSKENGRNQITIYEKGKTLSLNVIKNYPN